jgi:hypothetical protein
MRPLCRLVRAALWPAILGGGAASCVSPDSPLLQEAAEGCDEITSEDPQSVDVDPSVQRLMAAAADFSASVQAIKQDAYTACANIALDLGATDSWSSLQDPDDQISNADGTGACDQAAQALEARLPANAEIDVAICYARGYCYVDYQKQIECDTECTSETTCEPGPVETRCEPGALLVECDVACAAEASCMGSAELPANCMGKCESECQGECKGTCFHADGRKTENDPNCRGKCSSSCNGICRGKCKIDAPEGVECGADVKCQGSCMTSFTDPVCTSKCGPPVCTVEKNCHDVCTARVSANPVCVPTTVTVFINAEADVDLEPLRVTLEQNLPILIDAAEQKGRLAIEALERLEAAAGEIEQNADNLDGKSVACSGESAAWVARDLAGIRVTVNVSSNVVALCEERAQ